MTTPTFAAGDPGHIAEHNQSYVDLAVALALAQAAETPAGAATKDAEVRAVAAAALLASETSASGTYSLLAPAWMTGRAYVAEELVTNAGLLYRVTTAHTSAGAFDATKFTAFGGGGSVAFTDRGQFAGSTAYAVHDIFTTPAGDRVLVKTAFTSGATYVASGNTITLATAPLGLSVRGETIITAIAGAAGGIYSQSSTTAVAVPGASVTATFPASGVLYASAIIYLAHSAGGAGKYSSVEMRRSDTSAIVDTTSGPDFAASNFKKQPMLARLTGTPGASVTVTLQMFQAGGGSAQVYADPTCPTIMRLDG